MQFTFKRDDEGRETIEVGGVIVAKCLPLCTRKDGDYLYVQDVPGVDDPLIVEAIERADAAGFWKLHEVPTVLIDPNGQRHDGTAWTRYGIEVAVDVPIAETTVLSVTLDGEDQS